MPSIIDAVSSHAIIGEIMGTLRLAYGQPYDPYEMIQPPFRLG